MKHRVFTILSAGSLALGLGLVVLWAASYRPEVSTHRIALIGQLHLGAFNGRIDLSRLYRTREELQAHAFSLRAEFQSKLQLWKRTGSYGASPVMRGSSSVGDSWAWTYGVCK